jgi:hypothetical protein
MDEENLTAEQLAARYLARRDWNEGRLTGVRPPGGSLDIWERWIQYDPERAWPVFLELVRLRPGDDELLEQVWYRLRLLLETHGRAFETRVGNLISSNARLQRIAPPQERTATFHRPRPLDIPTLVEVYLHNHNHFESAHELETMIREDPRTALPLILEIIERGPQYEFTAVDTLSPLRELLRQHGEQVIADIEEAARDSVLVRRCLWRMRRLRNSPPSAYDIRTPVWERVLAAAGDTTDYSSDDPSGAPGSLLPEHERIVRGWFEYEETFWAWERVQDLVENDPEVAWRALVLAIQQADEGALEAIGAGPLEDLLSKHGSAFIERIEARARTDSGLREALSAMWQSEMSDDLWQRVQQLVEPRAPG